MYTIRLYAILLKKDVKLGLDKDLKKWYNEVKTFFSIKKLFNCTQFYFSVIKLCTIEAVEKGCVQSNNNYIIF